ncbi:MAG: SWIB/MDM2 domain-containing protein [bacterium]|nr:SWIB/MDM2 domain-containing protein [bacterium]
MAKKKAKKKAAKKAVKKVKKAAKKPAKKAVKKATKKVVKKAKKKRKANPALLAKHPVSAALGAVIGAKSASRGQVMKGLWGYIKKKGLQDSKNRRNINADAALAPLFAGKKQVSMFEMTKLVNKHIG